MALWGCYTKLHTANLYASLIQIISYTYTSMFNIYNYFEEKKIVINFPCHTCIYNFL